MSGSTVSLKTHYAVSKLMNSTRELAILEYKLENYGECAKRSIQWLRFYVAMLPLYPSYSDKELQTYFNNYDNTKNNKRYRMILDAVSIKHYDTILNKYMDCNKFLVGPTVYQLVQRANKFLPNSNQWEVFMTFNSIVELDKGYNESDSRTMKLNECNYNLNKVKKCSTKELEQFQSFIHKVHFRITSVKKDNTDMVKKFNDVIEQKETPQYHDYDIVNSSNVNDFSAADYWENADCDCCKLCDYEKDWTDVTPPSMVETFWPIRLSYDNAEIGQTIMYNTKKGVEYGKITQIYPTYVDIIRLMKNKDGSFAPHSKPICKASGNKPAFTRVITIV